MESNKGEFSGLIEEVREYLETRSRLSKLKAIDKGSQIASELTTIILLGLFFLLFLIFLSIAGALVLSDLLGKPYLGFLIVSVIYMLLAIILYFNKENLIKKPIANSLISKLLKDPKDEN